MRSGPSISADEVHALVDTSVAVALLVGGHEERAPVLDAVGTRRIALAGHAMWETYSVLTRLPPPHRRSPATVAHLLDANFPARRHLTPDGAAALLGSLAAAGISGGAVYDALVAAAALHHDLPLISRDRRALPVYRALGVRFEVVAD